VRHGPKVAALPGEGKAPFLASVVDSTVQEERSMPATTGARAASASSTPMRRLVPLFCLLALGPGPRLQPPSFAADPALIKEVLADGVYLLRAPSALDHWTATNVVVVVNQADVTVFHRLTLPATARLAIAEIRA